MSLVVIRIVCTCYVKGVPIDTPFRIFWSEFAGHRGPRLGVEPAVPTVVVFLQMRRPEEQVDQHRYYGNHHANHSLWYL